MEIVLSHWRPNLVCERVWGSRSPILASLTTHQIVERNPLPSHFAPPEFCDTDGETLRGCWRDANHLFPQLYSYVRMTWAWQTWRHRPGWLCWIEPWLGRQTAGMSLLVNRAIDSLIQGLTLTHYKLWSHWCGLRVTWRWNMSSVCQLTVPFTPSRVFHILHFSWRSPKRLTVGIRFTSNILDITRCQQ